MGNKGGVRFSWDELLKRVLEVGEILSLGMLILWWGMRQKFLLRYMVWGFLA